jgi:hypothetical protein
MNRYFYVPVIENCILHDGISLGDHLKMIDPELYEREAKYFGPFDGRFFNGIEQAKNMNNDRRNRKTDQMFKEKSFPRFMVFVFNEDCFYELASEVEVDAISFDALKNYEVLGMDVIDVFTDNPKYTPSARNFFDSYEHLKKQNNSTEARPKQLKKGSFFKR